VIDQLFSKAIKPAGPAFLSNFLQNSKRDKNKKARNFISASGILQASGIIQPDGSMHLLPIIMENGGPKLF